MNLKKNSSMDLDALFGKLHKHEIELKRLAKNEEGDKKIFSLKVLEANESGSYEPLSPKVKNNHSENPSM